MRVEALYVHAPDGVRLHLTEVSGPSTTDGSPTFLLLHGFAQNRLAYTRGALPGGLVARGARVLVGELRGHGLSDPAQAGWALDEHLRLDMPALVRRACERGGVDRVHLMGHSMGGILGYAMLARSHRLASLTTFGAPVVLGSNRPLVRLAARVLSPVIEAAGPGVIPMDKLLKAIGPHASKPTRRGIRGRVRDAIRLANPSKADPVHLAEIFENAHAVPKSLLASLAVIARRGRAVIDGVDLEDAVSNSHLPIAAVVGGRDVFATDECLAPIRRGPGRRFVMPIPDVAHVDITMGHHAEEVIEALWTFLFQTA